MAAPYNSVQRLVEKTVQAELDTVAGTISHDNRIGLENSEATNPTIITALTEYEEAIAGTGTIRGRVEVMVKKDGDDSATDPDDHQAACAEVFDVLLDSAVVANLNAERDASWEVTIHTFRYGGQRTEIDGRIYKTTAWFECIASPSRMS
jgi:hypothetical protein